ncbi:MAG: hypothetical protein ACO4AL_12130 [Steroidobacteraceae bacterium]
MIRSQHSSSVLQQAINRTGWSLGLALIFAAAPSWSASDSDRQQMKSLDEQVQEIKSDVLGIAAELSLLEEKLLYPSGTQVAVFVALEHGDPLRLDAVRLSINGQPVAHYIYSFKELDALRAGGVQRLYVGNLPSGEHRLEVQVNGKQDGGQDYTRTQEFTFSKGIEPELVGLTISGGAPVTLGNW